MRSRRTGFTFVEILTVFAVMALVVMFAMPKVEQWRARTRVSSARQTVASALATARAAAVQKGYRGYFRINDNTVSVAVDTAPPSSGASKYVVVQQVSLRDEYKTDISFVMDGTVTTTQEIIYDPRGFAFPRLGSENIIRLISGARQDSVCVARMGQILPKRCTL